MQKAPSQLSRKCFHARRVALQAWKKVKQSSSLLQLQSGSALLTLSFKPLRMDISIAGTPAASFNARQMFNYEHLREKKVGYPSLNMVMTPESQDAV